MVASTYNLGRLAYARKNYEEAAALFESILRLDPDNVLALKAAAYSRIMTGQIEIADRHYSRLLLIVPESADDGYNHALVLFAMERYTEAMEVLERYPFALLDNKDVHLLYARSQKALNKVEAIDTFARWLLLYSDHKVRYEYAQTLEHHEFYARALEEYRKALSETTDTSVDPKRSEIRFAIARALLIADSASTEGITELNGAIEYGFNDIEAVEILLDNRRISAANITSIRNIITNMRRAVTEDDRLSE
jgi:tetratricopeptide (TPR) repeat protein